MSLDELLTAAREHREAPDPGRFGVWNLLLTAAGSAAAAFAGYQVLLVAGYRVPYPLLFAVLVAGLLARKITYAVRGTPGTVPETPAAPDWAYESPHDRAYAGVRQWISRLASVEVDKSAFERKVRPAIVAVVDERLRLRHGVDRQRDPHRAEALLPGQLWAFVSEPPGRPPTRQQVEQLARQIEEL